MNTKTILKSSVAATALFALAAPVSTTAMAADDSFSSGQKTKLVMSGHVSRVIMHADDGTASSTFFSGPGGGGAGRVRWVASGTLSDSITAGATLEMNTPDFQLDSGADLHTSIIGDGGNDATASTTNWALRHQYVWVNHKTMGKLSLGNTSTSTDGIGVNSGRKHGRGIQFINSTGTKSLSLLTVGGVFSDMDGGRSNVLRYDTPTFGGAQARVAAHDNGSWDTSLRYAAKHGAVAVSGKAGYVSQGSGTASTNFTAMGSLSLTHDSGLSIKGGVAKRNFSGNNSKVATASQLGGRDDPHAYSVDLGYSLPKLVSVGATAFVLGWQNSNNMNRNDSDAVSWTLGATQSFDALGAKVALTYQKFSLDATNVTTHGTNVTQTFDDIDVIALQSTFNF